MHTDHISGLADPTAIPGEQIHVAQAEWDFWTDPDLITRLTKDARPIAQMIQSVANCIKDRVTLRDADGEIIPDLTCPAARPCRTAPVFQGRGFADRRRRTDFGKAAFYGAGSSLCDGRQRGHHERDPQGSAGGG